MSEKLKIDQARVNSCRNAAAQIATGLEDLLHEYTTTSIERTVVRLLGVDGVDQFDVPLANIVVEQIKEKGKLEQGIAYYLGNAALNKGLSLQEVAEGVARDELDLSELSEQPEDKVKDFIEKTALTKINEIAEIREKRFKRQQRLGLGKKPWLYVIVATGNIYEDVKQARAAAKQGADIIAVIRSTAQSLLDYVPYGATTEGFGGTYATQENFRIMREALDEVGDEIGRYIQLVNYCSGLCMPEIAAMGATEGLDMMLNDAIYGILFRDINMNRTFIDQHFSRMINAFAGVIINTGEDNYLTTADAIEAGHTVLASNFINEALAEQAGLMSWQMGLGHAFEIDPNLEDGFLLELAQAQLTRQLFPEANLKYMPPTKYMTANIFKGHLQDGLFNLAAIITGQDIQLLGMLTEAIHTPFLQDRALSIENAHYIFNNAAHFGQEITFNGDGIIQQRAEELLQQSEALLKDIAANGLMDSISRGIFAGISRDKNGGKGYQGVIKRSENYYNPFFRLLREGITSYGTRF